MTRIELADGKYTVLHEHGTAFKALRYGEAWRDLTGDGLVLAMAQEIERLRELVPPTFHLRSHGDVSREQLEALTTEPKPIDMLLFCPACGKQHIDEWEQCASCKEYDPEGNAYCPQCWTNPPHKSHKCGACGCIWRAADVPTNGVAEVKTRGKDDTFDVKAHGLSGAAWSAVTKRCFDTGGNFACAEVSAQRCTLCPNRTAP